MSEQVYDKHGIIMLDPLGINNTYCIAVPESVAEEYNLETISDLVPVAGELTFGAEHEFFAAEGTAGTMKFGPFTEFYGLKFKETFPVDISPPPGAGRRRRRRRTAGRGGGAAAGRGAGRGGAGREEEEEGGRRTGGEEGGGRREGGEGRGGERDGGRGREEGRGGEGRGGREGGGAAGGGGGR